MRMTKSVSVTVAVLLFGIVATSAHAAEVTHYKSRGAAANAMWSSTDGCVSTSVMVYAADMTTKVGGSSTETTNLLVSIWQYDWCTFTLLHDTSGTVPLGPNQFTGSKRLDNGSLLATIAGYDYVTSSPVAISININWVGDGDISRGMYQSHNWLGTYFFSQKGTGSYRSAIPSGTISDGVTNYATGYSWGQLSYTTSSSLTVVH